MEPNKYSSIAIYKNECIKLKHFVFLILFLSSVVPVLAQPSGCTDIMATNFDPDAVNNDGSCEYAFGNVSTSEHWLLPRVLDETSGLIFWNRKIWTHNDDSDTTLYKLNSDDKENYKTQSLESTTNKDWEEISQDKNYIYVGDFGNNADGNRTDLKILRIEKSSTLSNNPVIDTIAFSYSLQTDFTPKGFNNTNFDCEAFIVTSNRIYLFTKEWISRKTSVYSLPKEPGTYVADHLSEYDVDGLITGATYLEEKRLIVFSGYSGTLQPFLFLLYDFQNGEFFEGNKRKVTLDLPFHQVEGITTKNGLDYFISNERFSHSGITTEAKLHELDLSSFLSNYLETLSSNYPITEESESVVLYPNPARTILNFKLNISHNDDLEMVIYNQVGQKMSRYSITSDSFQIDVSNFSTGVYLYIILGIGNSKTTMKGEFIVQQ